ncbi:hypothetical protein ACFLYD_00805 [Chloroflexota bacterium]
MSMHDELRRLRIVVSDEETGEELASATGVETMILLAVPDTLRDEQYRRILLGDMELGIQLLFDILRDVTERIEQGTTMDLTEVLDDHMLLELTEGLPLH